MKVKEVMCRRVHTVREDAPLAAAVEIMLSHGISGLPVLGMDGQLAGMLTEGDLLRREETATVRHRPRWISFLLGPGKLAEEFVHTHGRRVGEVMHRGVVSVSPDTALDEVVALMEKQHIKRVPVLDGGRLAGLVSRADLMPPLLAALRHLPPAPGADEAIRARLWADICAREWGSPASVSLFVRDGEVTLRGCVSDPRQLDALRVAAENTPGVTAIHNQVVWCDYMSGVTVGMEEPGRAERTPPAAPPM